MMRNILCILILFVGSFAFGQDAPDFVVTDSKGVSHELYKDYLDVGKTVVLKVFFTTCPPCNAIAPATQQLNLEWGDGDFDVEFFDLSTRGGDNDGLIDAYGDRHGLSFPGVGGEGGSIQALAPYRNGDFGTYRGTPSFIVIAPDKSVTFDPGRGSSSNDAWIDAIDAAIEATGANRPGTTSIKNQSGLFSALKIYPNPVANNANVDFDLTNSADIRISIVNILGSKIKEMNLDGLQAGYYTFPFELENTPKGNYFLRIEADGVIEKTLRIMKL